MLIIVDKKIPAEAKENLSKYGKLLNFSSSGITYEAISGHPDIFFCKIGKELIVAPNTPEEFTKELKNNGISFKMGSRDVGGKYPDSAIYNAMVTDHHFVHNCDISDTMLLAKARQLKRIHINQGYCRCNLLLLKDNHFITSDKGISKALIRQFFTGRYVAPDDVLLPGFDHGFLGGAMGVWQDKVFVIGNLDYLEKGKKIRKIVGALDYELIELYDGPLFDGGSILFIPLIQ
ncbi:MAG: hypothetical protein KAT48_13385 [Bacteroidales bacterium]|nr:hypothetical protein [Bacteroidales bacterium]